jgi:diacylglycerol kinase family enzyme
MHCAIRQSQFLLGMAMSSIAGSWRERRSRPSLQRVAGTAGVDVMLAAGGDGTVSTAAGIALATGMPLAVLPAGTMNLFARALQLPLDLSAAMEAIAGGEIGAVDIATAQ